MDLASSFSLTYLAEIVPDEPKIVGTTDAGVFFDVDGAPCVWRTPFPPEAQQRLVTVENPEGDITNSDLEQAGVICHLDVVANTTDIRYCTVGVGCDNTPHAQRH